MHHISKLLMDTAVARQSVIVVTLCKRIVTYISRKFPQVSQAFYFYHTYY